MNLMLSEACHDLFAEFIFEDGREQDPPRVLSSPRHDSSSLKRRANGMGLPRLAVHHHLEGAGWRRVDTDRYKSRASERWLFTRLGDSGPDYRLKNLRIHT
jgi:hypothetical protein